MPFYDYECQQCKEKLKTFHSMNEQLHNCDKCEGIDTLKKIPSLLTSYSDEKRERDLAGERVQSFIEDSRKVLLDSRQEAYRKEVL